MTVRDVILHDHALITGQTLIRVSETRTGNLLARGTMYHDEVLSQGDREVAMMTWTAGEHGGTAQVWVTPRD